MAKKTIVALALGLAVPALAQPTRVELAPPPRTVTVAGDAVVPAPPDRALVTLGVETTGTEPAETLRRHEEDVQRVLTAVRNMGVPDRQIQIQSLSLNERYTNEGVREGYVASRSVTVTTDDLRQVPDLVATVVGEGANRLYGLSYVLRERARYEDQALTGAFARARAKAEGIAAASGLRLGDVVAVVEQGTQPPPPMPLYRARAESMMAADGVGGAYSTGEQEVRAAVVVTYELVDAGGN